jgi:hypothetical protein
MKQWRDTFTHVCPSSHWWQQAESKIFWPPLPRGLRLELSIGQVILGFRVQIPTECPKSYESIIYAVVSIISGTGAAFCTAVVAE